MAFHCDCCCFIKLISIFLQLNLFVLIFVFLPTKGDYEKIYMTNDHNETIKINQTILGFSIIVFIYIFFFIIIQCVGIASNSDNKQCVKVLMIFKLILSFIVWTLSLALISNINKILNSDDIYSYAFEKLDLIKKKHIINVILLLSANLLLNILDFFIIICGIFDSCCKKETYSYNYPSPSPNNENNNNDNKGRIVLVQYRTTVIRTTKIDNN